MKNQHRARSYKGYDFLARMRRGSLHLTVTKSGTRLDCVPAGCASPEEALQDAILDHALSKALAKPAVQRKLGRLVAKAKSPPCGARPFRLVLQGLQLGRSLKNETNQSKLRWAKRFIANALAPTKDNPDDIREFPIDLVPYERYYAVRDKLDGSKMGEAKYQSATLLARVTAALIEEGLDWHCRDLFTGIKSRLQHEAAGQPFAYAEIKAILDVVDKHVFGTRFLFWSAYSGGPEMEDVAGLELAQICRETGKVSFARDGTIDGAEFALVADGLDCLRQQSFAPSQVYVNPDWIYTAAERKNPNYLQLKVNLKERWRADHIKKMAEEAWEQLMADAKISGEGKSFSSTRKELYAFLSSMGVKRTVLAKMLGISLDSLRRYELPAEWEFFCMRDLREKHLAAIRRQEQGHYIISKTQVLMEMKAFVKDYLDTLERLADEGHLRVTRELSLAFEGVSQCVKKGMTALELAQANRHSEVARKVERAWTSTVELEDRLLDLRLEVAAEWGFDDFK